MYQGHELFIRTIKSSSLLFVNPNISNIKSYYEDGLTPQDDYFK